MDIIEAFANYDRSGAKDLAGFKALRNRRRRGYFGFFYHGE
jgi:hypothetical protein